MASPYSNQRHGRLPKWLGRDAASSLGRRYQSGVGEEQDAEDAKLKATIKLRFAPTVPDDALFLAGADRLLERAPVESADAFRLRLVDAPTLNTWIGTRRGIRQIFDPYGFGESTCHVLHDYETQWDGHQGVWFSRCFVALDDIGAFETDGTWADPGVWGDGGTWDSTVTEADVRYWSRQIRVRKSPIAYPVVVVVVLDGEIWDAPSGTWDEPGGTWDATVVYIPIGHVWEEEEQYGYVGDDGLWDSPGVWGDFEEAG